MWQSDYSVQLDNITSAWLPNTYQVFGESGIHKYNLADTRLLSLGVRLPVTLNRLHPACYAVTKILDMFPKGIIKYTFKMDEWNPRTDNVDLLVCDYYSDTGDIQPELPRDNPYDNHRSRIIRMVLNDKGELEKDADFDAKETATIAVGEKQYFKMVVTDDITAQWKVTVDNTDGKYTEEECSQLQDLMVIRQVDGTTISIRAGKSYRLPNVKFKLSVSDINGDYSSSIELEVVK